MSEISAVLFENMGPIFIVVLFGYLLKKRSDVDKKALTRVVFYIFSPCLLFSGIVASDLVSAEFNQIMFYSITVMLLMGGIGFVIGRMLGFNRTEVGVIVMAAMFTNGGNFGLPLNQLRYGDPGLARAIIFFFCSGILMYTIGVLIVSSGKKSLADALRGLARLPIIYAVFLGLLIKVTGVQLPVALLKGLDIAGDGAIPIMLAVLGMQLADITNLAEVRIAIPATLIRLIIGPIVAVAMAELIGLQDLGRSVSILQASMPVAVATTVLATEFDVMPEAMTTTVVLSTLLSPITLVAIIQILGL